jgi:hypothetical protein
MVLTGILAWEPWPLTSFRFFSTVRTDRQTAWVATTVTAKGREEDYPLGGEERGFRGFPFVMAEFASASTERQSELCRTWVDAAPDLVGRRAEEVRIYLRTWSLSDRVDDRAREGTTQLKYVCTSDGVERGS